MRAFLVALACLAAMPAWATEITVRFTRPPDKATTVWTVTEGESIPLVTDTSTGERWELSANVLAVGPEDSTVELTYRLVRPPPKKALRADPALKAFVEPFRQRTVAEVRVPHGEEVVHVQGTDPAVQGLWFYVSSKE